MTHTARLVWLRVQNPAEVEANVCLNCNFMSDEEQVHRTSRWKRPCIRPNTNRCKCTGRRKPIGRRGERDSFFFSESHTRHTLWNWKILQMWFIAWVLTQECVLTSQHQDHCEKKKKQYWDYETSTQRKRHVYAISNMCGLCAKYSKPNWHGSRQRATSSSRLLFSVFCHAHVTHILCAYPY